MRRVGLVFILLGVVFAVLAAFTLFLLFPRQTQPVPEPSTSLVVAFQNIPEHTEIGPDQVGTADWPQHIPTPSGGVQKPGDVVGKIAQVQIYPGQPVLNQLLIDKNQLKETHSNAALILVTGTLAIALPVDTTSNVAEAIEPGDHVDLIATFSVTGTQSAGGNQSEIVVTQRLLQDILVLQVGTWPRPAPAAPAPAAQAPGPLGANTQVSTSPQTTQSNPAPVIVTLQLDMQDVLVLRNMQANASSFTLALRPANDQGLANPTPVTIDYLQQRFGFKLSDLGR